MIWSMYSLSKESLWDMTLVWHYLIIGLPKARMDTLPSSLLKCTSCTIFCFFPHYHDAFHLQFQRLTGISSIIEAGGSQWGAQPWLQQFAHWSNTSQSSSEATKYPASGPYINYACKSFSHHTLKPLCDGRRSSKKAVLTLELNKN